ncbi:porin family protein [Roseateles amylovorans]|uniref:Porin family protein n=1 Tax=Roseateles amylovorans TaxID=2978473 RepID=A0ABY6B0M8_9BURK|nr:porin family protein [Roseateles amylovorans]UXH78497.1 porin family protein [Roseateles amylovorans]
MKTTFATTVLVVSAAVGASAAHAADLSPGVYATIVAGKTDGSNPTYRNGGSPSLGGGLGYRFAPEWGVEVFTRGLDFELLRWQTSYAYPERHSGVALTGELPLNGLFGVTGRIGLGQTQMKRSGDRTGDRTSVSAGAGLAMHLGSNIAATLGYERYTRVNVNAWLLGVEFRF